MLTVDLDRLGLRAGMRVLDVGCGQGRHAFAAARRGARVVALDHEASDCKDTAAAFEGEGGVVTGDGLALPFGDASFERVIASEVLEHVPDDRSAMAELARVLRPGGRLAVTVPAWFPERVCWALAEDYHAPAVPGGHIRIYRRHELIDRLRSAGLRFLGSHHSHALHSPYWWLKCAMGVANDEAWSVRRYHGFLVREILRPSRAVRRLEQVLNPLLGKSLVVYVERPQSLNNR